MINSNSEESKVFAEVNQKSSDSLAVLMIAPTSFFNDYGGHIRILEEARVLTSLGHRITIVTYHQGSDIADLTIHRTRALPWHADYEVGSSRHKLAFDVYLLAKTLQEGLKIRPDIVHGHMHEGTLIGGALAKLRGIPLVFDFQGGLTGEMVDHGFLDPKGFVYPWVRRLERTICHLPQAILTSSHRAKGILMDEFGVGEEIIHSLPDCVDTNLFDPKRFSVQVKSGLKRQLGIPESAPVVAYLGLLADYQGTPQMLKAAAHLHRSGENVHFLIMGYPRVDQYRNLARQMGIAEIVTFTGKIEYSQAPLYLSLGDVAISAKMSATEGSGKVLNYMAMAQPTAAFDTPVHREYLGDFGRYAKMGDSEALAAAIKDLVDQSQTNKELGTKLRQRAIDKFSWQSAGRKISELYKGLTSA